MTEQGRRDIEGRPLRCLICESDVFEERIELGYAGSGRTMAEMTSRLVPRRRSRIIRLVCVECGFVHSFSKPPANRPTSS